MEFWWVVLLAGVIAIAFALWLARNVLSQDKGTPGMQEVASLIFEGAMAFLNRQYRTIAMLAIVAAVIIGLLIGGLANDPGHGIRTAIAFLVGAFCSGLAGFIGMYIAVQANLRTAAAAQRSVRDAINVSLRGGAVSGFLVVALSMLGVLFMFWLYGGFSLTGNAATSGPATVPFEIVGFGFGASFVALFAQLGGGIYTKAADVGADLVGKVEAGIPEDDPRNAAVIADLVGDNVGDCAGRGADLFESTAAENIGAMILGVALYVVTGNTSWVFFPLVVRSVGIIASMVGILAVAVGDVSDPQRKLDQGYWAMTVVAAIGIFGTVWIMLDRNYWFALAGLTGLLTSVAFVYITQYYTAGGWRPVQELARASRTGPATNIISGVSVGLESTGITAIIIAVALGLSYFFGTQAAQLTPSLAQGNVNPGLFGTAVATMGMLTTVAYVLSMDTFGPITDNAGGIAEFSQAPAEVRHITDVLDGIGNTTKALTKGYAVGSAALAAFLLFSAYLDEVKLRNAAQCVAGAGGDACRTAAQVFPVDLSNVTVFIGGFLGLMLIFFFSSLAIRAVGRAASIIIEEVRRQFREHPGIMQGTEKPDYARAVDITTQAGLREMILPGLLAVLFPIVVGLVLKAEAAAALLMVGTMGGILMATVLNNSGGTWDNAKKFIELGQLKDPAGSVLGKGTDAHAAAVVGDTVGDPFKDTAGPSLHVLIKLLSTITLVMAPLFIGR
ncbi:MAG: sodium-translocating pyrophosphatase [Chloroflexi bacterium]|nr:sodium-translocating pyrophosphatase [Chloroflexota bacterium]MBV9893357.1 sodium-translocating pyrophosphatase [Chloroflexota bacterium]